MNCSANSRNVTGGIEPQYLDGTEPSDLRYILLAPKPRPDNISAPFAGNSGVAQW